jgi:hypothetical protein
VLLHFFLGWGLDVGGFVDRVELPALDWVGQRLVGALDAFEEGVVFGLACCGFLVGVVLEDLLAVRFLDLLVGGSPAVLGESEYGVVILTLDQKLVSSEGSWV